MITLNLFKNTNSNKRYYTLDYFYKRKFGCKIAKISLNGGFTCPNIDGTKGYGGCIYCSKLGSGDFAGNKNDSLKKQFYDVKKIIDKKWKNCKYIAYFQANTNTYAPIKILKQKYEEVLKFDNVVGLSIATRCDCISDECLDYLEDLSKRTFLTVELGLQTIHEKTANFINRCHNLNEFTNMVKLLRKRNINVVVHIINGLPYETKEMMLETTNFLNKLNIQGIKIHMLHIVKNTQLAKIYSKEKFKILNEQEYVNIVCDQLENLKPEIVINRITGDPKKEDLIEPKWCLNKIDVLNNIDKTLLKRNTYQGFNLSILNKAKQIMDENLRPNDLVIDATVGNGYDTLFLAKLVNKGKVFGFDIQKKAINNTLKLTKGFNNIILYNDSHENMNKYFNFNTISLIIFNLGYLPNGDKSITTNYISTIKAIKQGIKLLNNKGIILIVVYRGHKEGLKESIKINKFLKNSNYNINYYYNTDNINAPYLITIKKDFKQNTKN